MATHRNLVLQTEYINKWLTLLANLGVLIGIIFLAVEVRQSNRIAMASTEISVRDQFRANNELVVTHDSVAELLVKAADIDVELSAVEEEKLYGFLYVHINTWMGIETAYENGMLPRKTFNVMLEDIPLFLQWYPAIRPYVREFLTLYPSEADSIVYGTFSDEMEQYD